jgi:hypothetical protein
MRMSLGCANYVTISATGRLVTFATQRRNDRNDASGNDFSDCLKPETLATGDWIGAVRPSRRPLRGPRQDEELSLVAISNSTSF